MTEKKKMLKEMLYNANNDKKIYLKKEQSQKIYVSNLIN